MPQSILRNEDFKSGTLFDNIRGLIYKGDGSPVNRADAANPGALYIDNYTGQLWVSLTAGDPATWRPYFSDVTNNARIDSDVQDGDMVGIFGPGSWSVSGSLSVPKQALAGGGSQNAAFVAGGLTTLATNATELFNGSIWSMSGVLSQIRYFCASAGGQNAGLVAGGQSSGNSNASALFDGASWAAAGNISQSKAQGAGLGSQNAAIMAGGVSNAITNANELFNGSTWVLGSTLIAARVAAAGAGSQNAGLVAGGFTNANTNSVELFNGSSWIRGASIRAATTQPSGAGSQNAGLVAGGATSANTNSVELFNGSTWFSSGSLSVAKTQVGTAGSQNAGLAAGGLTATRTNATELHNQSVYRKLTYSSAQSALNIGMAINVTTTSLTATVIRGDLPSTYIPGGKLTGIEGSNSVWFGISRFNNIDNNVFVSSATATISSISVSLTNQATLNLSTAITSGFAIGGLLLVSSTSSSTKVLIVGGDPSAPVVRWENVSSSASTSLTVGCLWGQKTVFDSSIINNSPPNGQIQIVCSNSNLQGSYRGRVGDSIYIPYASVSGANGSSVFAGTFKITYVLHFSSSIVVYLVDFPNIPSVAQEVNIGKVTLLQQLVTTSSNATLLGGYGAGFSSDDVILGYRNKMHFPAGPIQDELSNGRF